MKEALVLVAHADDESLGAGGLIPKLVKEHWNVSIVIVADGVVRARGDIQDNRADAERACRILGVEAPTFLGFSDQQFDTYPISEIVSAAFSVAGAPDVIVTHSDTDLNKDHRIVSDVAKLIGRPKSHPISILACEIPGVTNWNGQPFPANYFVDITDEIDTKVEAFSQYGNEVTAFPHPASPKALRLLAELYGVQCGCRYAEAFRLIRGYAGLLP